ncbi:MAG: hypothetical protein SWC96_08520 [Thermodesulfobacteriota bacterium]|nr:hypothetical protein [Thermodesulfobacteriota bacterium]
MPTITGQGRNVIKATYLGQGGSGGQPAHAGAFSVVFGFFIFPVFSMLDFPESSDYGLKNIISGERTF